MRFHYKVLGTFKIYLLIVIQEFCCSIRALAIMRFLYAKTKGDFRGRGLGDVNLLQIKGSFTNINSDQTVRRIWL